MKADREQAMRDGTHQWLRPDGAWWPRLRRTWPALAVVSAVTVVGLPTTRAVPWPLWRFSPSRTHPISEPTMGDTKENQR